MTSVYRLSVFVADFRCSVFPSKIPKVSKIREHRSAKRGWLSYPYEQYFRRRKPCGAFEADCDAIFLAAPQRPISPSQAMKSTLAKLSTKPARAPWQISPQRKTQTCFPTAPSETQGACSALTYTAF